MGQYEKNRASVERVGRRLDPRVKVLDETRTDLNCWAKATGKIERYSIDHIVPMCQGGMSVWENLWICPLDWNDSTSCIRDQRVIDAIHTAIAESGRVFLKMPEAVLAIEQVVVKEQLRSMGFNVDNFREPL